MSVVERAARRILQANNDLMRRSAVDRNASNPRDPSQFPWVTHLVDDIRAEWDEFSLSGGQLPHLRDLLDEDQGSDGPWKAGLLISKGKPATRLAERFPATVAKSLAVPGIWSALWSVLPPGTELPEHRGPNAGVLRFHLGVACPQNSALRVNDTVVPYRDRHAVLFDDRRYRCAPARADEWNAALNDRLPR